jgi:cold shock CspA family protein
MIWFNPAKRHGFIRTEDGERLLVEEDAFEPGHVPGDRCKGTIVSFERIDVDEDEPRATNVTVVPRVEPGRARARRR